MAKKTRVVVATPVVETPVLADGAGEVAVETTSSKRLGLGLCGLPPMRRMDFQDALLEANREMRLTDRQLSILMEVEHPWGCAIPEHYVVGIRRLYNAGTHTKNQVKPSVPVPRFNEAGVEEAKAPRAKRAKAEAETAEAVAV